MPQLLRTGRAAALALVLLAGSAHAAQNAPSADTPRNGLESSLTLYVYPPRHAIDWSTPKTALKSFLGNIVRVLLSQNKRVKFRSDWEEEEFLSSNYKSTMGHTIGHVRCTLPGGATYDKWASLSGQDIPAVDKILLVKQKLGLGALFYDYVDGHIISGAGNVMRLTYYRGDTVNGAVLRPRYVQFEIDQERCAKLKEMVDFFESFHFPSGTTLEELMRKPPESLLYFTNSMDPYDSYVARKQTGHGKVGGGCAPFGAALLKEAGLFRPEFDGLWRTPVSVSERLIGGLRDRETGEPRRVSILSLLFGSLGSRWNHEGYASRRLSLYDPQKIWEFSGNVMSCLRGSKWCRPQYAAYVGQTRGELSFGEPHIFRGPSPKELKKRVSGAVEAAEVAEVFAQPEIAESLNDLDFEAASSSRGDGDGPQVEQKVEGFVWRLAR